MVTFTAYQVPLPQLGFTICNILISCTQLFRHTHQHINAVTLAQDTLHTMLNVTASKIHMASQGGGSLINYHAWPALAASCCTHSLCAFEQSKDQPSWLLVASGH